MLKELKKGGAEQRAHALTFGGSVWCFNRAADGLMFLARRTLALPVCHYVDDFVGVEPDKLVHGIPPIHSNDEGAWDQDEGIQGPSTSHRSEGNRESV